MKTLKNTFNKSLSNKLIATVLLLLLATSQANAFSFSSLFSIFNTKKTTKKSGLSFASKAILSIVGVSAIALIAYFWLKKPATKPTEPIIIKEETVFDKLCKGIDLGMIKEAKEQQNQRINQKHIDIATNHAIKDYLKKEKEIQDKEDAEKADIVDNDNPPMLAKEILKNYSLDERFRPRIKFIPQPSGDHETSVDHENWRLYSTFRFRNHINWKIEFCLDQNIHDGKIFQTRLEITCKENNFTLIKYLVENYTIIRQKDIVATTEPDIKLYLKNINANNEIAFYKDKLSILSEKFENNGAIYRTNALSPKDETKEQAELLDSAKECNSKLLVSSLINSFIVLHDLSFNEKFTENTAKLPAGLADNKRILPPELIGKIIHFAGIESFTN